VTIYIILITTVKKISVKVSEVAQTWKMPTFNIQCHLECMSTIAVHGKRDN